MFRKKPRCRCCGNAIKISEEKIRTEEGKRDPRWICEWCSVMLPIYADTYNVNTVSSFWSITNMYVK